MRNNTRACLSSHTLYRTIMARHGSASAPCYLSPWFGWEQDASISSWTCVLAYWTSMLSVCHLFESSTDKQRRTAKTSIYTPAWGDACGPLCCAFIFHGSMRVDSYATSVPAVASLHLHYSRYWSRASRCALTVFFLTGLFTIFTGRLLHFNVPHAALLSLAGFGSVFCARGAMCVSQSKPSAAEHTNTWP
jgi:hypothetical protein